MLIQIVYEFFVKYIFGGTLVTPVGDGSSFSYTYYVGVRFPFGISSFKWFDNINAITFTLEDGSTYNLGLGNYLSFIATLISMVAIVLICCSLIKKIYNMCAHIIG